MLRFSLSIALVLFGLAATASAQERETPRIEVFTGYSYMLDDTEISLHGAEFSVTTNLDDTFGVVGTVATHFGGREEAFPSVTRNFSPLLSNTTISNVRAFDVNVDNYLLMGGPQVTLRGERVSPFVRAQFGILRAEERAAITAVCDMGLCGPFVVEREYDDTSFAAAVGGGLDVKISERVAFRALQADYVMTFQTNSSNGGRRDNLRVSTGLVFSF